ncbi:MAG: stage II sporulation protein R [Clostridia bacterium]|jgi:stage II sporulation protein R|nr:stage II sporulation protein R [Clostridia bacterium]
MRYKLIVMGILVFYLLNIIAAYESTPPLIRLHILAASDSAEDQRIKYRVRDHIVDLMNDQFRNSASLEESKQILLDNLEELQKEAETIVRAEGGRESVRASYGVYTFPAKNYGAFVLGPGRYEALRLVIGPGAGANWWCVLFPPLCFVDGQSQEKIEKAIEEGQEVKLKPALAVVKIYEQVKEALSE